MSYQPHNFQPRAVLLAEQLNEMDNEIARISGGEGVLSENVKQSLLECFENVAWINDQGQTYYDNLYNALYPPLNIESISAVFDSGSNVIYDNMTLDDLKQYLTVTATLTDYSTQTVTDYVLSGNMTAGNQTITVSYGGKTTTFTVTVVEWLTSISAVFTQGSATIYDTDTLDTLRQYLVVTATYSDSTTAIVTDYTLSGTLTEGTSTITVSYGGKTDTFNVTVASDTGIYPLENGTHTFTLNNRTLTVTNGYHCEYTAPNATSSGTPAGAYLNLSKVSENDDSAKTASNINKTTTLFTLPAGASVVFEVKNISFENLGTAGSNNKYAFALRNNTTSIIATGDKTITDTTDIVITQTISDDTPITCVFAYLRNQFKTFVADIGLTVNGVRWI